jgi:hypothetical protein
MPEDEKTLALFRSVSETETQSWADDTSGLEYSNRVRLDYDLREHKKSIFTFGVVVIFDSMIIPVALFFTLWYCTDLDHDTSLSHKAPRQRG